jgi:hypothetical protein
MFSLMKILRFAVAVTIVAILLDGAAMELHQKVAAQVRAVPGALVGGVFDRDFDFDGILPAGRCRDS